MSIATWLRMNKEMLAARLRPGMIPPESQLHSGGWDRYAREWKPTRFQVLRGHLVRHLGDEWTAEPAGDGLNSYGLSAAVAADFAGYLRERLIDPYVSARARQGLEIGPGGGRVTTLLVPRTEILHVADVSKTMLGHLRRRFAGVPSLRYHHTDGLTLPRLPQGGLDYVIAFDVFVHFEPRLVYSYLAQITGLLQPGGAGIIHYANMLSPLGWRLFEMDLAVNLARRASFTSFGVMCPQLMQCFLERLGLDIVSVDTGLIPRDAVAVFRRPNSRVPARGVAPPG